MKGLTVRGNKAQEFFITRDMAARVLETCPNPAWPLFAVGRFGGLRCPSEHLWLRWEDINWAHGEMLVRSPKTERHEIRDSRWVPIFPELWPHLDAVWDQAEPAAEWVITRYRSTTQNLRTHLERIIRRAGLDPWPKLWQNPRATRATELVQAFPAHVAAAWLGHSTVVAREHYLQVRDEDFQQALERAAESGTLGGQNAAQHPQARRITASQTSSEQQDACQFVPLPDCPKFLLNNCLVGRAGLEPATSAV